MGQDAILRHTRAAGLAFGALLILTIPAPAGVGEDLDAALEGVPLLVYGSSSREADAVSADLGVEGIRARVVSAGEVTEEDIASSDLLIFGTPDTNPLIPRCLDRTPLRLTATSVTVGDSSYRGSDIRLAATLPHPVNPDRRCILYAAQQEELLSGIFFGYGASYVRADFLTYRKSDGLYYPDDRLAYGELVAGRDGVTLGDVTYGSKPPRQLAEIAVGAVRLYYDTFDLEEARIIARYVDALRGVAADEFGIPMPETIHVYLYSAAVPDTRVRMYTDAWNTFWSKVTKPKDEFLSSEMAPVAFAHEVARLAFQPVVGDPEKRHPYSGYNDDWSHYFQFTVLVPSVWERLGPGSWPVENDFHETWGRSRFDRLYRGASDTYAALLLEIENTYGRRIIGRTLSEVTHDGIRRNVAIEEYMEKLAAATGDASMMRRVAGSLPSTLEWSTNKRMEPLGCLPRLEQMIDDHEFVVDSVTPGSDVDRVGMRPGDEIVAINGFDLATAKGRAHRSMLEAIHADGSLELAVRRDTGTRECKVKIRQR